MKLQKPIYAQNEFGHPTLLVKWSLGAIHQICHELSNGDVCAVVVRWICEYRNSLNPNADEMSQIRVLLASLSPGSSLDVQRARLHVPLAE